MPIDFDVASNSGAQTNDGASWSHTCSGDDRALIVGVALHGVAGWSVSGVTYSGTDLTFIGLETGPDQTAVALWELANPDAGTHDIAVTLLFSATWEAAACSFTGIDQTTPTEGFASISNVQSGDGFFNLSAATSADGDWVIDICSSGDDLLSCDNTERTNLALTGRSCSQATFGPQSPPGFPSMGRGSVSDTTEYSFAVVALRPVEASALIEGDGDVSLEVLALDAAGESLFSGDAAVMFDVSALAAAGGVAVTGAGSVTLAVSALAGSGTAPIGAGPGNVTFAAPGMVATGSVATAGVGSVTLVVSALAATGGITTSGPGAMTFVVSSISAAGATDPDYDTVRRIKHYEEFSTTSDFLKLS